MYVYTKYTYTTTLRTLCSSSSSSTSHVNPRRRMGFLAVSLATKLVCFEGCEEGWRLNSVPWEPHNNNQDWKEEDSKGHHRRPRRHDQDDGSGKNLIFLLLFVKWDLSTTTTTKTKTKKTKKTEWRPHLCISAPEATADTTNTRSMSYKKRWKMLFAYLVYF